MPVGELIRYARAGRALEPVIIVGDGRSGSSLLYRLLQQQPAFGPHPPQLAESGFMLRLLTERDLQARSYNLRNFLMDDPGAWERFEAMAAPLLRARSAVLRARAPLYAHPRAGRLVGSAALARAYLALAAEVRGVRRLVEKTPYHTVYTEQILAWLPGARLLFIHRHPVDVLTSYWRRAKVDPQRASWGEMTVESFAARYEARIDEALGWARRRPEAFRLVSYEALVAAPETTVAELCAYAGEPFDPAAVAAPQDKRRSADPHLWGEVTTESKRWSDFMTREQAADLEARLSGALDALGYPRYAAAGA